MLTQTIPNGYDGRPVEPFCHQVPCIRIVQRAGTDGVNEHRDSNLVRNLDFTQVSLGFTVVQDPAPTQNEGVEPLDLDPHLFTAHHSCSDSTFNVVPPQGIFRVTCEDGYFNV